MGGVNCKCDVKKWLFYSVALGALYLGMDMFLHHYCMGKHYREFAHLFRPMEMAMSLRWWGYAGYILFGLLFTCIYMKGYEEGKSGLVQGFRYGLLMGVFYWGASLLISYPHMLYPKRIIAGWFAVGVFEFVFLGCVLGYIYKPKSAS